MVMIPLQLLEPREADIRTLLAVTVMIRNTVSTGTVSLPAFSEFEQVHISDTVHQSLNF